MSWILMEAGGIILTGNIYTSGLATGADAAASGAHVNFGDPVTDYRISNY